MASITLIPLGSRNYTSTAQVLAHLNANRDFIVADMSSPWDGKPCNLDDLVRARIDTAKIRYNGLRSVHVVNIEVTGKV